MERNLKMKNIVEVGESSKMSQESQDRITLAASSFPGSTIANTRNVYASSSAQQHFTSEIGNGSNGNNVSAEMVAHQAAKPGLGEILSITQGNLAASGSSSVRRQIIHSGIRFAHHHQFATEAHRLPPRATTALMDNSRTPTTVMNRRAIAHGASSTPRYPSESSNSSTITNLSPPRPSSLGPTNPSGFPDVVSFRRAYNPNIFPRVFSSFSPLTKRPSHSTWEPITLCKKHLKAGFLKLEDIQNSEAYCCTTRNASPCGRKKVVHTYYDCTLKFNVTWRQLAEFGILARALNPFNSRPVGRVNNSRSGRPFAVGNPWNSRSRSDNVVAATGFSRGSRGNEGFVLMKCGMCNDSLHGDDIHMYHEVGYCKKECRDEAMLADAIKELIMVNKEKSAAQRGNKSTSTSNSNHGGRGKVVFFIGDESL